MCDWQLIGYTNFTEFVVRSLFLILMKYSIEDHKLYFEGYPRVPAAKKRLADVAAICSLSLAES